ncbi:MAG TPA: ABC transporter permease [Vicinamibacterales bacterium]
MHFLRHLVAALRRRRLDDQLREEMTGHLAWKTRAFVDEGVPEDEARRRAALAVGNVTRLREDARAMWGFPTLDSIAQDLRYGGRVLRRSPMFAGVAIVSLAIGIGAASTVFSLADAVLFRSLAVRDPGSLVVLKWRSGPATPFESLNGNGERDASGLASTSFSYAAYETFRSEANRFLDVVGFADLYQVNLGIDGRAELGTAHAVGGNYFDLLGVVPVLGRPLGVADDRDDTASAAVISYRTWHRRFGGTPDVVGRAIDVNGVRFTIAGVAPEAFHGTGQVGTDPDVYVPLAAKVRVVPNDDPPMSPSFWWVLMIGRLKPGIDVEEARSALDLLLKRTAAAARPSLTAADLPRMTLLDGGRGQEESRRAMADPLQTMAIVAAIVLLVACANVAGLLLARGRARLRELSVRVAIGSSRSRVIRQLFTEAMLVALLGAALGLVSSRWMSLALAPALSTSGDPVDVLTRIDARVLAFAIAVAVGSALLFGLLPAFRATDIRVASGLQAGRGDTSPVRWRALSGGLVVVQIALSLLLLTGAGLLARTLYNLQRVDVGFDAGHLLLFQIDPSLNSYDADRTRQLYGTVLERLRAAPGVRAASLSNHKLISNSASIGIASRLDETAPKPGSADARAFEETHLAWELVVDERFFDTMRQPLVRGRAFAPPDAGGPPVAVINRTLAQKLFGTEDAVGRFFKTGTRHRPEGDSITVIGVAADARYSSLRRNTPPTMYRYYPQFPYSKSAMTFEVRTAGPPTSLAATVREIIGSIDPNLPVFGLMTQTDQIETSLRQERLFAALGTLLAGVALLLSAIGLYGLLAYAVTRRTPEIGLRMALGAARGSVLWMVLRESLVLTAIGLAAGIPAALLAMTTLRAMLFGLAPRDPATIAGAATVMLLLAMAASFVPARRASRLDPMVALRIE